MKETPAYYQMRRDVEKVRKEYAKSLDYEIQMQMRRDVEKVREEYAKSLDYQIRFYQDGRCIHVWRDIPYEVFYNELRRINCMSDTREILGIREE